MILAALGCNLAWGIIDAGLYVLDSIDKQARNLLTLQAVRGAADLGGARRANERLLARAFAERVRPQESSQ